MNLAVTILVAYFAIGITSHLWFNRELEKSTPMCESQLKTTMMDCLMRRYLSITPHIVYTDQDSRADFGRNTVFLNKGIADRRDLQSMSVAIHEAAHWVQWRKYPWAIIAALLSPALLGPCALLSFLPAPFAAYMPSTMLAGILIRFWVELDAWLIAHDAMKRWGYGGVSRRLAIASVVSYL